MLFSVVTTVVTSLFLSLANRALIDTSMDIVWWNVLKMIIKSEGYEAGPLSFYKPGDGYNHGELSCGGRLTNQTRHIAHRRWKQLGCNRRVLLYATVTGKWAVSHVRDAGPFGIIKKEQERQKWKSKYNQRCCTQHQSLKGPGHWRMWTKSYQAPKGWKWRGVTDLSVALWKDLGRPPFLSQIHIWFLPALKKGMMCS